MAMMSPVREPRTLPVVLSHEEVARLIAAARYPCRCLMVQAL
jgi:hypothetical protein